MTINNYTSYPGSGPGLSRLMVNTDRRDLVVYLLCLKINKYQRDNLCRRFRSRFLCVSRRFREASAPHTDFFFVCRALGWVGEMTWSSLSPGSRCKPGNRLVYGGRFLN